LTPYGPFEFRIPRNPLLPSLHPGVRKEAGRRVRGDSSWTKLLTTWNCWPTAGPCAERLCGFLEACRRFGSQRCTSTTRMSALSSASPLRPRFKEPSDTGDLALPAGRRRPRAPENGLKTAKSNKRGSIPRNGARDWRLFYDPPNCSPPLRQYPRWWVLPEALSIVTMSGCGPPSFDDRKPRPGRVEAARPFLHGRSIPRERIEWPAPPRVPSTIPPIRTRVHRGSQSSPGAHGPRSLRRLTSSNRGDGPGEHEAKAPPSQIPWPMLNGGP